MSDLLASRAETVSGDKRALLRQRLESGEARIHPISFPQRELWETSPVAVAVLPFMLTVTCLPGYGQPQIGSSIPRCSTMSLANSG